MTAFAQFGDLYYMADFLMLNQNKIEDVTCSTGVEYISYVKNKFENLDNTEQFIPFDISDQYIGGLRVLKWRKGLIKIAYVETTQIHGYEIDCLAIRDLIKERQPSFDISGEWILSEESILEGLNWSLENGKGG